MLLKGVLPQDTQSRNAIVGAIVLIVAGILFFLPELSGLQRSLFGNGRNARTEVASSSNGKQQPELMISPDDAKPDDAIAKTANALKEKLPSIDATVDQTQVLPKPEGMQTTEVIDPHLPIAASDQTSLLDRVLNKINAGDFDANRAQAQAVSSTSPENQLKLKPAKGKKPLTREEERQLLAQALSIKPLTWEVLSRQEVSEPIKRAVRDSQTLMKVIDPKMEKSRIALVAYSSGLTMFTQGALKKFSPQESMNYLGKLDLDVTRALTGEGVSRGVYRVWSGISLGALVDSTGANVVKARMTPPFVSDVTLVEVKVTETIPKPVKAKQAMKPIPNIQNLGVKAVVIGTDASVVEVYRGKELISSTKLGKVKAGQEARKFGFTVKGIKAASGLFTVVAIDESGETLSKHYQFLPQARRVKPIPDGKYDMPKMFVDLSGEVSDKLDKMFLVGSSDGAGAVFTNTEFTSFNDLRSDF